MSRHQIDLEDAESYRFTHCMAGSHGKGENKTLYAIITGGNISYEVTSKRELIYTTKSMAMAVDKYNEI